MTAGSGGRWQARALATALAFVLVLASTLPPLARADEDWTVCPQPCKCKWVSGRKAAECANASLSAIPSGLSAQIQLLDASNNRLTILPDNAFRAVGLVNLQKAYLRECDIEELNKEALSGLEILIELDLSANRIRTLHPGVFAHNARLRVLILNRNPIQKIMDGVFANLKFLQTVEMNDCQVSHVAHKAFVNLPNLSKLRLGGNNLSNMKPDTLHRLEKLKSLELHNNPWNCDCHLKTFWEFIMRQNLYAHPTACRDPETLRGRLWSELAEDNLACKPEIELLYPGEAVKVDGGNATLGCKVQGNPAPQAHWVYKSRIITNHTRRNINDPAYVVRDGDRSATSRWVNLTIVEARFGDEGEYTCVARNGGGVAEAKLRLAVAEGGRGGGGVFGSGALAEAAPLIIGLVAGMVALLIVVVVLVCCYCRTKDPRTNNNTKKTIEGVSSNGDLSYHSGPGSEQEKSLITVVNPVQKPPRRYETLSTSTANELEMKATLLDNGSVITGPSVAAEGEEVGAERSLESLESVPARSRETIDAECGLLRPLPCAGPPDLLSFPSRGSQVSPAGSSASTAPDSSRLPAQTGPQSPARSPLYPLGPAATPHLFGTLPYSRSHSPFTPAPVLVAPRQGYVTIPRRPRVPSWSSPPPTFVLDPITNKLEPVYDNLGPRTTADGSSALSLNKTGGESPATPSGIRNRPLPPTPTFLPPFTLIAPIEEQPSPALARAHKPRSSPNASEPDKSPSSQAQAQGQRWARAGPDGSPDVDAAPADKRASVASLGSPGRGTPVKVPPKPPPKPKKKTSTTDAVAAGPLYEDEGEDGTEV